MATSTQLKENVHCYLNVILPFHRNIHSTAMLVEQVAVSIPSISYISKTTFQNM